METANAISKCPTEASAPYSILRCVTYDADEQAASLREWDQLLEQLTPGKYEGRVLSVRFGEVQVQRVTTSQSVYQRGLMVTDERMLAVPLAMQGNGYFCGRPISLDTITTRRNGEELDFRSPRCFDIIAASVSIDALTRYAQGTEQRDIDGELGNATAIHAAREHAGEIRGFLLSLLDSVLRTPSMLQYAATRKELQHAILAGLARAVVGAEDSTRTKISPTARHSIVRRVQDYMREHAEEPLTVEDLCRASGASRRTLQYAFQEVLQNNPMSYLRALRLNGVRRALKSADPARDTVQDIAARWGFWHLSNFAIYYRRMFGELPSQTLHACHRGIIPQPSSGAAG